MNPYYLPDPIYQLDGSEYAGSNCWAAVGAWQLDGRTGGEMRVTPTRIRVLARKTAGGGGSLYDIQRAFQQLGLTYRVATLLATDVRAMLMSPSRKIVAVPTEYELWPKKCDSPGFDGFHMVGIQPGLLPDREVRVMNPLCSVPGPSAEARFQKVALAAVMKAATSCAKQIGIPAGYLTVGIVQVPKLDPAEPDSPSDLMERRLAAALDFIAQQRDEATAYLTADSAIG